MGRPNDELRNKSGHTDFISYFQSTTQRTALVGREANILTVKQDRWFTGLPDPLSPLLPIIQGYILCPHIVAVCKFELVVLLFDNR